MVKMQHCFNCGEELGVYRSYPGDVEHCGKRECAREAQYVYQYRDAEAQEAAAADNFDRYR